VNLADTWPEQRLSRDMPGSFGRVIPVETARAPVTPVAAAPAWFMSPERAALHESPKTAGQGPVVRPIDDGVDPSHDADSRKQMNSDRWQAPPLAPVVAQLSGIAHDLNNVVTAILGYGERALSDAARGSRLRHDLDMILAASNRARLLIEQILAPNPAELLKCTRVDVNAVVREALDLLVAQLPAGITIDSTLKSGGAATQGCSTDVHRLFMNLATNAIQAMPKGGTLRVAVTTERVAGARTLCVGSISPRDYVVLQVADAGTGIGTEIAGRIFDQFFSTRKSDGGTGLGLAIVREIVTAANGAIAVDSAPGVGSCFTVYLPQV